MMMIVAGNGRAVLFHRMKSGETGGAVTAVEVQGAGDTSRISCVCRGWHGEKRPSDERKPSGRDAMESMAEAQGAPTRST